VNAKLKEENDKVESLQAIVDETSGGLEEVQEKMETMERKVEKVEKTVENVEKVMEEEMYEEMRAREAIRRNVVMYGVKEANLRITDGKERMEADKEKCEKILIAAGSEARKKDIRFCCRIGEKGEKLRPVLLGLNLETIKCNVLDQARELRNTVYKDVGIGPDQTKKQRQAEARDWQW
jgi:hypothetical protein